MRAYTTLGLIAAMAITCSTTWIQAAYVVTNGSFESYDSATGSGMPMGYPYPRANDWTYTGTPLVVGSNGGGLAGAISETLAAIPETDHGANWLLLDERMIGQTLHQAVGTINLGETLSLSALVGRPTNVDAVSDFQVALYRSNSGGTTPATLLTAITKANVAGIAAGGTMQVSSAPYTATAADAGQTLFVRMAMLTGNNTNPVFQTVIDNVTVTGGADTTPPTLTGISDDKGGGPVAVNTLITYSVAFSKDMDESTVDASDFATAGTALATIGSVSESAPGVFAVQVAPTTEGTLQLLIPATSVLSDTAVPANNLDTTTDILDDTIITVNGAGAFPIALANPGFDVDTVADGNTLAGITGWTNTGTSGVLNPSAGVATPVSGENVAFTDSNNHFVFQSVPHTLLANSRYTLTIHVGRQIGHAPPSWRVQLLTSRDNAATVTDFSQLFDGGATNTRDSGTTASGSDPGETTQGNLYQVRLTWETGTSPSGLGDPLFVRFFLDKSPGGPRALWDDVSLSYEPLGEDTAPPMIVQLTPPSGGFTATDANFTATFNEPVTAGTGLIILKRADDDSTVEAFDVASSSRISFFGNSVSLDPTADLEDDTGYYIEIAPSAIKDVAGRFFAGFAGSEAWNFTTRGAAGTVASGSGNLSLEIDHSGAIRKITLGGGDGGPIFQRTSLGESRFASTITRSVAVNPLADGMRVVREIENAQGGQASVTETFGPGLEDDSISWEMVIESTAAPWTTSLQTYLQMTPNAGDLKFWSAGTRSDLPVFNGYPNPLTPMPFSALDLRFGGEGVASYVNNGFSVPIASWLNESGDRALSLVHSPFDFLQYMQMQTDATGAVRFQRTNLRIGGGNTIRLHMQLVAHPADWRAGLGFMTRQYPAAFDPHNPEAHVIGGGGTYADYRGEALDAARYRQMGLTLNWNARFPWPYLGMSIPPVRTDTEEWMSFLWAGKRDSTPQSAQLMNHVANTLRQQGFHQLEYFTLTEAGTGVVDPAPPRKAADDADLWKDPNDFVHYQIPNANLGIAAWNGGRVLDPGDPAWQAEILRQISDLSNRLPSSSGICIDRLDWLNRYNPKGDDGVTWTGSPKRSLMFSWHDAMEKLIPITKARNKVVFVNSHTMRRIDVLRHSDGFYAEQSGTGIHHMLAFAGLRKPVVIWNSPAQNHTAFQEGLYLGFHHSVPFPKADHNTNPNASLENWFLNYGPLYNAMRGRKWLLLPDIIEVTSTNALANIFEVDSGFVIPVVFGGSATSATVKLGALPISQLHSVEVLHPGGAAATPITPTPQGDGMVLTVPLVTGCAMVRVLADKSAANPPIPLDPTLRILPEG